MLIRLVSPVKRPGSANHYFVQRIPADVRKQAEGLTLDIPLGAESVRVAVSSKTESIKFSLRTASKAEVRIRQGHATAYLETVWRALRTSQPIPLTHRQATALAGELYRAWVSGAGVERTTAIILTPSGWVRDDTPETQEEMEGAFEATIAFLDRAAESGDPADLETPLGPLVDRLLLRKGIAKLAAESRPMVLEAFWLALRDAMERRKREAGGDYSPDPKSERFPEWRPPEQTKPIAPASSPAVSLTGLLDGWWKEAAATGRKPSTHESYQHAVLSLVAFLKHDDAARISPEDVVAYKDFRVSSINPRTGKKVSPKTVRDSDLAGLKTVFGWAVRNKRLPSNPADGITIKLGRKRKLRSKGFTDAEASAILNAALSHARGREQPHTFAAKRWVPWLCAYTGARVGELAQLRKQDLSKQGEHWVIHITPEAGTVKTDAAREVVLHEHVVALGFPEFVAKAPPGHLFLKPSKKTGDVLGPLQGVKNRLAEFAREVVTDPNVAPNHGWRHRFKTVGMEAGIAPRILDAIQGQAPASVADTYGDVTVKTIAAEIAKLPRVDLKAKA